MQTSQKLAGFEIFCLLKLHFGNMRINIIDCFYNIWLNWVWIFLEIFADNMLEIFQKGAEKYVQKDWSIYQEQRRRANRREPCFHGGEVAVQPPELPQNEHRQGVPHDRHADGRFLTEIPPVFCCPAVHTIFRTCPHRRIRTSFRQILPQTALKMLAGRQPACAFLPCL